MRKYLYGISSLVSIIIAYLVIEYILFELHGMREYPLDLLITGIIVIILSGIVKTCKALPVLTALGYIIGFALGYVFNYDYQPGYNNLWIIWTCIFAGVMILGFLVDIIVPKKRIKRV